MALPDTAVSSQSRGSILQNIEHGVLRLTLANPPANALSVSVMRELQQALDDAAGNRQVRVIIIAAGGSVFCAGHDLKEMTAHRADADGGRLFYAETMAICSKMMTSIVRHPRPVIAEVDGIATAAGCQLVASCDLAVASERAAFATPGVNIGLFCSTPMVALSRNVGRKQAMEMLLTGEKIDAGTARDFGLVNRVVPHDGLSAATAMFADRIAAKSTRTLKTGKEAFYQQLEMGLSEAYEHAAKVMVENMMARDAEEGINAFVEKREPLWTDE